jgi:hypothetical protein
VARSPSEVAAAAAATVFETAEVMVLDMVDVFVCLVVVSLLLASEVVFASVRMSLSCLSGASCGISPLRLFAISLMPLCCLALCLSVVRPYAMRISLCSLAG